MTRRLNTYPRPRPPEPVNGVETEAAAALLARCDDGAWPAVLEEMQRGARLTMLDTSPRYALDDGGVPYGPTLSAMRVHRLVKQGIIRPAGKLRYELVRDGR